MLDILDCFWKHYCARDFSLYLSYFLTNIGASVLVKRFFNCFHSALLNSIVYGQYILPIALVNRERCEELFLLSQCILNLWLDMDKITNVYIESAKHGVLERHSKKCDPKLVDATVKNKQNWNWLTETDFSEHNDCLSDIQLKSINLVRHIAFTVVFQKCMVLLENEVCKSMQNEISFTSNSKNKYSYTSVLSRTQWKKQTT